MRILARRNTLAFANLRAYYNGYRDRREIFGSRCPPMHTKLLIKSGLVFNAATANTDVLDVLISGHHVKQIASCIVDEEAQTIDARGRLVVPGLVDVHVHFRQPGQEYKEDIHSGSRAAAAGGFTTVVAEPNTCPPVDTPHRLKKVLQIAAKDSVVNFYSKAAMTRGIRGHRSADIRGLAEAGARAISDDGHPVPTKRLMRNALNRGRTYGILVNPHCEDSPLYLDRMLKGRERTRQGEFEEFKRRAYWSEAGFIARDIALAEKAGARIHISHVSLARSVEIIANAKKRGVLVTAEATPHHFLLSEKDASEIGTNAKVNPPLRSEDDVKAIRQGLADGIIDIIASDHAPHSPQEKNVSLQEAPFGIIGLETTLGLVLTYLVRPGILTLNQAIEKMTLSPAKIFGLDTMGVGSLTPGTKADVTVIDPEQKWKVDVSSFYSKGRNCPFHGWELQGKAILTVVGGRIVMKEGKLVTHGE